MCAVAARRENALFAGSDSGGGTGHRRNIDPDRETELRASVRLS
jgi:hypothetical protein